jgi:transcriptional regulator with XRE-family HTH domain
MDSYSAYVGTRIKHFRKAQNLTIEDLARIINKSKSAVSKYENGQISIDIETLKDIADALKINVSQIIYYTPRENLELTYQSKLFNGAEKLYIYYCNRNRLIKCFLQLHYDEINDETKAWYYLDLENYSSYIDSKYAYTGNIISYESLTYFMLQNNTSPLERIYLCVHNPLGKNTYTVGLATGIHVESMSPLAMRILVSKSPIKDEQFINDILKITKEDIKYLKETSMFVVPNYY